MHPQEESTELMIDRRNLLSLIAALGGVGLLPSVAFGGTVPKGKEPRVPLRLGQKVPFSRDAMVSQAARLAQADYSPPPKVPQNWVDLTYDQYRGINFKPQSALWKDTERPFNVEFFAPGLYFPSPISVSVVEDGMAQPVLFSKEAFRLASLVPELPFDESVGYSGFRIKAAINDPVRKDEFVVFQGASYFRAVGRHQFYGLSARGLAINTADPSGEEFPDFRSFWIEGGERGSKDITIHALMDSPSVTGLYSFKIVPGVATEMDVKASLFPRRELTHVGLGAETSMFLFDETNRNKFDDFRPAVHDSDGLLIENGAGETLWRPLANPRNLQVSSFVDDNPKGFGLLQRPRDFADYADLEAKYHKRPGLWVTPGEDWGKGAVTLVEIPADREIYDNIVAYWRPRKALPAGQEYRFSYRLAWCETPPVDPTLPKVVNTRMGKRFLGGRIATIDFAPTERLPEDLSKITRHVSSNRGEVSEGILQRNPNTGGVRLAFTFDPGKAKSMELRAQLMVDGKKVSEVWLYRWTA